jgi:hypothetical protein
MIDTERSLIFTASGSDAAAYKEVQRMPASDVLLMCEVYLRRVAAEMKAAQRMKNRRHG